MSRAFAEFAAGSFCNRAHDALVAEYLGGELVGHISRLKEHFGTNNVMVKGHHKVILHLMFGVVTLFADQLLRLIG